MVLIHWRIIMMIYGYIPKTKKRKVPKLVQQRHTEWLASIEAMSPKRNISTPIKKTISEYSPKIPPGRETPRFASVNTGFVPCTKKLPFSYTGDKMKGVATMHKSNAVPVFTDKEAKEISSMRR
jgi:hypothetical protein